VLPATVDQHAVLSEFLGYLVGGRDEPGGNAEPDVDDEGGGDRDTTEKIVDAVAEHQRWADGQWQRLAARRQALLG